MDELIDNPKWAIIKKSNISAKGLETKSLAKEIKKLKKENYQIFNFIN